MLLNDNKLKLGLAIYKYKIEAVLLDKSFNILNYASSELPKGFDPLPHAAELVKLNFPKQAIYKLHSIGVAFPAYIDSDHKYINESYYFPEYKERAFTEELMLALQINPYSYLANLAECDFAYGRTFSNIKNDLMTLDLKQGVFAKVQTASWQKIVDWEKIGHTTLSVTEKIACVCGRTDCLETQAGDIALAKKFANKYDFKNSYIQNFLTALDNNDSKARLLFKKNLECLFSGIALEQNFHNLTFSLLIATNISEKFLFDFIDFSKKYLKKFKSTNVEIIIADSSSTVIGAALAYDFYYNTIS